MTQKSSTINDVALMAGVSKATAAQVCRGTGRISAATREMVLEVARQLSYNPNPHAQRLAHGRCANMIGVYSLNLDIGPGTAKIKAIQRRLTERGFDVPVHSYGSYGGGEVVNEVALMRALCAQRPAAIICSTFGINPEVVNELADFERKGGIVVCYDTEKEVPFDNVIYGIGNAIFQATRHLLELGHRKVGFCLHGAARPDIANFSSFSAALEEFGVAVNPAWLFHGALYEEAGMLYARQFLALPERPTAIHIANDVAASAFINEVQRAGVRVPDDLSVVGLNDSLAAQCAAVPLTTVSQPLDEIVEHVVELLDDRLQQRYSGPARRVWIQGHLAKRQSTAPPAA